MMQYRLDLTIDYVFGIFQVSRWFIFVFILYSNYMSTILYISMTFCCWHIVSVYMSTILYISMTFCCWHIVKVSNNACSILRLKIYLTTFTSGWGINNNIDLSCIVSTSIKIVFQWFVTGRWFSPGTPVSPHQ